MSYRAKPIPGEVIRSFGDILNLRTISRLDVEIGGRHLISGWSLTRKRHNPLKAASKARRRIRRAYAKMVLEAGTNTITPKTHYSPSTVISEPFEAR